MPPVSAHYHLIFSTNLPPIDFSCLILRMSGNLRSRKRQILKGVKSKNYQAKILHRINTFTITASFSRAINKISNVNRDKRKTVHNWLTFNAKLKETAGPETSKMCA